MRSMNTPSLPLRRSLRVLATAALGALTLLACSGAGTKPAGAPVDPAAGSASAASVASVAAPALSHEIVGKEDCVSCHVIGAKKPLGVSEAHKGRNNAICSACHLPAASKTSG